MFVTLNFFFIADKTEDKKITYFGLRGFELCLKLIRFALTLSELVRQLLGLVLLFQRLYDGRLELALQHSDLTLKLFGYGGRVFMRQSGLLQLLSKGSIFSNPSNNHFWILGYVLDEPQFSHFDNRAHPIAFVSVL